jgi:magnesium chelatase family protein
VDKAAGARPRLMFLFCSLQRTKACYGCSDWRTSVMVWTCGARIGFAQGAGMVARVKTVAFQGIEAVPVDVQVMIQPGGSVMNIVGLPDKAVAESRERVRAALHASGLSIPPKRVTVNLAPADLPKEGSHYDLPIALGLMAALGAVPADMLEEYLVIGELSLDGTLTAIAGALPAAMGANAIGKGLICPAECGPEAAWASAEMNIVAPRSLIALANHFRGTQVLSRPEPAIRQASSVLPDLCDIKGQETARRALEIAAAGGHNMLLLSTNCRISLHTETREGTRSKAISVRLCGT